MKSAVPLGKHHFIIATIIPAFLCLNIMHLFIPKIKSTKCRFSPVFMQQLLFNKGYCFFHQEFLFDIKQEAKEFVAVKCRTCVLSICFQAFQEYESAAV